MSDNTIQQSFTPISKAYGFQNKYFKSVKHHFSFIAAVIPVVFKWMAWPLDQTLSCTRLQNNFTRLQQRPLAAPKGAAFLILHKNAKTRRVGNSRGKLDPMGSRSRAHSTLDLSTLSMSPSPSPPPFSLSLSLSLYCSFSMWLYRGPAKAPWAALVAALRTTWLAITPVANSAWAFWKLASVCLYIECTCGKEGERKGGWYTEQLFTVPGPLCVRAVCVTDMWHVSQEAIHWTVYLLIALRVDH